MRFSLVVLSVVALASCTPPAPAPAPSPPPVAPPAGSFAINVTLSEKALAKLTGMNEKVTVAAMLYGEPQPGFEPKEAGDVGVGLGNVDVTLPAEARMVANFAPTIDGAKLAREVKGEARVLVNVFSARNSHENNLLSCGIFDDAVSAAAMAAPTIDCKLIEE
jgi:hypothetical protein